MSKQTWAISHGAWHTSLITLAVISLVEIIGGVLIILPFLSPKPSETRTRRILKFCCCCIIKDDEVIDSLVSTIMRFPSFNAFSFTDIIAGLIMNNLVYHEKKKVISSLVDSSEKLQVKTMRVHEYLNYLRKHDLSSDPFSSTSVRRKSLAPQAKLSTRSVVSLQSSNSSNFSKGEEVVDKKGRKCVVLSHQKEDGIFEGVRDMEAGVDASVVARMQYNITPDKLEVG